MTAVLSFMTVTLWQFHMGNKYGRIIPGVGPCGATLWQFHRVADSCTCTAVHVRDRSTP